MRLPEAEYHKKLCEEILERNGLADDLDFLARVERLYLSLEMEKRDLENRMRQHKRG